MPSWLIACRDLAPSLFCLALIHWHGRKLAEMRRVLKAYDTFYAGHTVADGVFVRDYTDSDGTRGRRLVMSGGGIGMSIAINDGLNLDAFVAVLTRQPIPEEWLERTFGSQGQETSFHS